LNIETIEEALMVSVSFKLKNIVTRFKEHLKSGGTKKDFINSVAALDIVIVCQEHFRYINFLLFKRRLSETIAPLGVTCPQNKKILNNFCMLFGLCNLTNDHHSLYECGYFK